MIIDLSSTLFVHLSFIVYCLDYQRYLILFAPQAFVPQRQFFFLITAFASVLTANLLTFRRYTSPSVIFFLTLAFSCCLRTLYTPSHDGKYSSPTSYRVCWHVSWTALSSLWSLSPVILLRCSCVRLSSIAQFSPLLPLLLGPNRVSV